MIEREQRTNQFRRRLELGLECHLALLEVGGEILFQFPLLLLEALVARGVTKTTRAKKEHNEFALETTIV